MPKAEISPPKLRGWQSSGLILAADGTDGMLHFTDDLLRAYLRRPELQLVDESCPAEIALNRRLNDAPREPLLPEALTAIIDPDARENYAVLLKLRRHLMAYSPLEAAYLAMIEDNPGLPMLFVDHLVHLLVHHVLRDNDDPFAYRAAELLFREQRVTVEDGNVLLADAEVVEQQSTSGGLGSLGQLLVQAQAPMRRVELDVLTVENAPQYWGRADRFDMVLDLSFTRPGLDALCRVLETWVHHLLGAEVSIQPVQEISDERWRWHLGLDSDASAILNDLYNGVEVEESRLQRLVALFRLEFRQPAAALAEVDGRPVYLGLAHDKNGLLRMKPQNLLANLPLRGHN